MMDLHMMYARMVLTTQIMQAVAADPVVDFQLGGALFTPIIVERDPKGGFNVRPATEAEYFGGRPGLVHPSVRLEPRRFRRLKKAARRMNATDSRLLTDLMLEWAEDYARHMLVIETEVA